MPGSISRRNFLKTAVAAVGAALPGRQVIAADPSYDLLVRGGTVLDGTGGPAWAADIAISGDSIAAIGQIDPGRARRVIDATGLHVCPGFIDIHTHSDGKILSLPTADSRVRQGITLELTGNCGGSCAPIFGDGASSLRRDLVKDEMIEVNWSDTAGYFRALETEGISINQAMLLGQGTLRQGAVGLVDRELAPDELAEVLRKLEEGMEQGAFGLSTGLEYVPGSYTPTYEIIEMARMVARRGGLYASHIRNECDGLLEAINEALAIGRATGVRVEVSHLKAAGKPNWDKQQAALDLIVSARGGGVDVLADAYPYPAYSTGLTILLPSDVLEGGHDELIERLNDKSQRPRILAAVERQVANDPGGFELIGISRLQTEKNRHLVGRNMRQIAGEWGMPPAEAMLRLLIEESAEVAMIGYAMKPENVEMVLSNPLVMIGSDGHCLAPVGKMALERPHPRNYGTCPRVLGLYARERGLFNLPAAVKKMTSMPADQIGIADRGRIARGMKADIVAFDAGRVIDTATFDNPHQYPSGIEHVLVNGVAVVSGGSHTGARPGQVIRKA